MRIAAILACLAVVQFGARQLSEWSSSRIATRVSRVLKVRQHAGTGGVHGSTHACDYRGLLNGSAEGLLRWQPCGKLAPGCPLNDRAAGCVFDGVRLRNFDAMAHGCLGNLSIAFFGDSLSRYMYLSLATYLHTGRWGPRAPGQPQVEDEHDWHTWRKFYEGTNAVLGGNELCDCFGSNDTKTRRLESAGFPSDEFDDAYTMPVSGRRSLMPFRAGRYRWEHRYYYHPELNLRLAFSSWLGGLIQGGLNASSVNATCHSALWEARKRGEAAPHAVCAQNACGVGNCSQPPEWLADGATEGLMSLLARTSPDVIIMNAGHWEKYLSAPHQELIVSAIRAALAAKPGLRIVWRETTPISRSLDPAVTDEWDVAVQQRRSGLLESVQRAGATVFPAYNLTEMLARPPLSNSSSVNPFWDRLHYNWWPHAVLNQLLITDLCRPRPG